MGEIQGQDNYITQSQIAQLVEDTGKWYIPVHIVLHSLRFHAWDSAADGEYCAVVDKSSILELGQQANGNSNVFPSPVLCLLRSLIS